MIKTFKLLFLCAFFAMLCSATRASIIPPAKPDSVSIEGRWDMTIDMEGKPSPSWLQVRHSGYHTLVGEWVGVWGSARPVAKINYSNNKISFSLPPQWETGDKDMIFEGSVTKDGLNGTVVFPDGKTYNWTAVRAPLLKRAKQPVWGKPVRLFNGRDLTGWHAMGENQWKAENGILRSPKSGANLVTDKRFIDFKLHIEFRYPKGSNSGVYLRGRYEVQIMDSKVVSPVDLGGVYGFIAPSELVAKAPGEWQSYDITLVGRMVTIVANGKKIVCNQEIPGITGGALDSKEGEPGPLLLQGDHGPIEYRNIMITPAK
jgi:hypothetical protein